MSFINTTRKSNFGKQSKNNIIMKLKIKFIKKIDNKNK